MQVMQGDQPRANLGSRARNKQFAVQSHCQFFALRDQVQTVPSIHRMRHGRDTRSPNQAAGGPFAVGIKQIHPIGIGIMDFALRRAAQKHAAVGLVIDPEIQGQLEIGKLASS
jgi:hypothetical protein